ncbi:MAG: PD-(D/E)XK motif protein [Thermoguttaceae bacterium]|nr:PD-(D/E)XK motif protein [Thermoguttaceae bacterium]
MNTYEAELRQKWDHIGYRRGGALQLAIPHALEWYVRYVTKDQKSIVIVSDLPVDSITSSRSIETACNQRRDGKYAISFTLVNRAQEDVFISMSSNIIEYSKEETTQKDALAKVLRRYAQWLKLLDHKRSSLLSLNAQKGLIAELSFLKEMIEKGMPASEALSGWVGPEGSDQDFFYSEGWYEIKATGTSSVSVTITSIEQLDCEVPGELVIYRIDKCARQQVGALTLYNLVHDVISRLTDNPGLVEELVLKLASVDYFDTQEYDNIHFVITDKTHYEVNEIFPRMVRDGMPKEIVNAEYQIDLPSIDSWAK